MIAFPEMLVAPAEAAGIKVPPDLRSFNRREYLQWTVFCVMQLGSPMPSPTAHWENAKVIATLSDNELMTITSEEVLDKGFQVGHS